MRFVLFGIMSIAMALGACSQSVSSTEDDDPASLNGPKKNKVSSSSRINEKSSSSRSTDKSDEEDCSGESGEPWDGTTAKDFACGTGTKLSPYIILTAEQLARLSFLVNASEKAYSGKYFKLGADILLNKGKVIDSKGALVADSTKLHKWTPIGNSSVSFDGNFDGDGHTISGMFINTTSTHNGLFGNSQGTVQNLTVENSWVYGGKYTAGVVGANVGMVLKITNQASVSGKDECIGGVIGSSGKKNYSDNSVIKNAVNKGIIIGEKNVGGVAGCATYVTVDGAENLAPIEGYGYVGGVFGGIGSSSKNDVKNLKNSGKIIGKHFVGGVAGHCGGSSLIINTYRETSSYYCSNSSSWPCGKLKQAANYATVSGKYYVGGVLGVACGGSIDLLSNVADVDGVYGTAGVVGSAAYVKSSNVYNRGNVSGGDYVGGIFSYNKEGVTNSAYSTGKVDGDSLVGLMIGYNYNTTMADYYYLERGKQEPFGLNNGGGVATPKTEDEMKSKDFAKLLGDEFVYDSGLNDGYPVLSWEKE